jgi:hypothetical protein
LYCKECILNSLLKQKKLLLEEMEQVKRHNLTVISPEERAEEVFKEKEMSKFMAHRSVTLLDPSLEASAASAKHAFWQPAHHTFTQGPSKLKEKVGGTLCHASKIPHPIR